MLEQLAAIGTTFNVVPHLGALVAAYLLALPIGWDREKGERSAGLRTFPLVAIASCGFIQATENLTAGSPEAAARRPLHRHGPHRRRCGPCRDEAIAPVHNRMPVLLRRDDYERWLLGSFEEALALQKRTFPPELINMDRTTELWAKKKASAETPLLL